MYLDVFNKVVDSDDFTVGGGSASALAGAMAAGMASMVAKLSMAKPVNLTQAVSYTHLDVYKRQCQQYLHRIYLFSVLI